MWRRFVTAQAHQIIDKAVANRRHAQSSKDPLKKLLLELKMTKNTAPTCPPQPLAKGELPQSLDSGLLILTSVAQRPMDKLCKLWTNRASFERFPLQKPPFNNFFLSLFPDHPNY